jgi:hypothetical protein
VAVREPEGCRCRFRCDPKKQDCPAGSGRICSALADDHGKPLPYGACLLDEGADIGQPCAPEKCRQTLFCVGVDTETAFCRQSCSGDPAIATCPKEMVCSAVRDSSGAPIGHACTPAEGPVTEGGDCSHESCAAALLCVADRKLGHPLCRRVCEPAYTLCPAGTQCTEIVDDAGTRLGYACVPP